MSDVFVRYPDLFGLNIDPVNRLDRDGFTTARTIGQTVLDALYEPLTG